MKKLLIIGVVLLYGMVANSQDILEDYSENAWGLKFKNQEKYDQGKRSKVYNLRNARIKITSGGKTVYIDGKKLSKSNLTYFSNSGIIKAYDNNDQWYMYYYMVSTDLFISVVYKENGKIYKETYKLWVKGRYFDEIRKYAYKQ